MAEIISLKQKRKTKTRAEKETQASANRLKFGRTKGEKQQEKLQAEKASRHLDGHKKSEGEAAFTAIPSISPDTSA